MRFGGRVAAAIEVLEAMEQRHLPVAIALREWGLSHRFAGSGDRAAIGNIVYDALRRKRSAAYLMGADTARARVFGALLLSWDQTPESIERAFDGDRFAPDPLSGAERDALAKNQLENAPDEVRADCPDWCAPMLKRQFGDNWVSEASALSRRPPLDLRVNTLKSDPGKVAASLGKLGAKQTSLQPAALRIPPIEGAGRHPNIQSEPGFQKGHYEIQDLGSQISASLTGATSGEQVLDFCAGGGGKTLAMSAKMENRGQLFAYDTDKHRLAPIFDRMRRAGCRNVQVMSELNELEALDGRMDLVLVDAPCTGSGTWRRKPDAKWRLTEAQLEKRKSEQATILDSAARYVKSGGRLAYVTCSVFPDENTHQVEAFVSRRSDFGFADHGEIWGSEVSSGDGMSYIAQNGIVMTPAKTGTDGFFISVMRKQAAI